MLEIIIALSAAALTALVFLILNENSKPQKIPPPVQAPPKLSQVQHPEFLQRAKERDIQYLVHFTRAENLPNILQQGLISRKNLDAANENFVCNDVKRLDNLRDTISLSATFPNYKMNPKPQKIPLPVQAPPKLSQVRHPEFLQRAKERDIQYLVHFTRLENLPNILQQGLISRKNLDAANENFVCNDVKRLDNLRDTISLSVTFPNYRMFYRYQKIEPAANWAIILLDAQKVLSELDCAFNFTNASSNRVKNIPLAQRMTLDFFDKMFYEPENDSRANRNLRGNEPTDPQAEILCLEKIPVKFFIKIIFENNSALQAAGIKNIPCVVDKNYFSVRHDYKFWKTRQE